MSFSHQSTQTQVPALVIFADTVFFVKGTWGKSLETSFLQLFVTAEEMSRNPFLPLNNMSAWCRLQHAEQNKPVLLGLSCPADTRQGAGEAGVRTG